MQRLILSLTIAFACLGSCMAQFRALQSLPWYPTAENRQLSDPLSKVKAGNVLDELNAAFNEGRYVDVVYTIYPRAIKEGYQRNLSLYNNTRRALRQLMLEDATDASWKRMQSLYEDRFRNVGRDSYDYRNSLETSSWCDEQLQNEYTFALASQLDRYEDSYQAALKRCQKSLGHIDLAVVLQGMFSPLNRAHVAHPEIGPELTNGYQEVLRMLDASEEFMEREHKSDYLSYYSQSTLEQVRKECRRVIGNNQAFEQMQARKEQKEVNQGYANALALYRQKNYSRAYNACNEALREHDTPELHALKSNILQSAGNAANNTADRVAFWCAAYEQGRGYVSSQVLNHLLDALRTNLFMSGTAGKLHKTSSVMVISQRVWTLEQLKEKTGN